MLMLLHVNSPPAWWFSRDWHTTWVPLPSSSRCNSSRRSNSSPAAAKVVPPATAPSAAAPPAASSPAAASPGAASSEAAQPVDPGQHILVKQRSPSAVPRNGGGDTFFGGDDLFLWVWPSHLAVFKSFIPLVNLFYLEKKTLLCNWTVVQSRRRL